MRTIDIIAYRNYSWSVLPTTSQSLLVPRAGRQSPRKWKGVLPNEILMTVDPGLKLV